jgi:hypothetical protein
MNSVKRYKNGALVEFTINGIPQPIDDTAKPPLREWPFFLRPMKLLAKEGDKGLGDIVERAIGPAGGDAYKAWYEKTFGKPCGCTKRQDNLNDRFPLPGKLTTEP